MSSEIELIIDGDFIDAVLVTELGNGGVRLEENPLLWSLDEDSLADQKEKMRKRFRDQTERWQRFVPSVADLDPDGPVEELRDQARRLSRMFVEQLPPTFGLAVVEVLHLDLALSAGVRISEFPLVAQKHHAFFSHCSAG